MRDFLDVFKWSIAATVAGILAAAAYGGLGAAVLVAVLIGLEGSISFDNAVVNAAVLRRMSAGWQRAFLTVGIVIAVFGMRLAFPILVVAVATRLGVQEVIDQALTDQDAYARNVERAAPIIGAFGGAFLLMVAMNFLVDADREEHWLGPVDRGLARLGRVPSLAPAVAGTAVAVVSQLVSAEAERDVLLAGLIGIVTYIAVRGFARVVGPGNGAGAKAAGASGFGAFLYLEMLDASFSLDSVLGAFAITQDVVLIALGLGVGAVYIRSLTLYLVRRETLQEHAYLTHGAHWAIAGLGVILFVSIEHHVPEWLTAGVGLGTVGAAFGSSVARNRREDGG